MHLIFKTDTGFLQIPFGNRVKFQLLRKFQVDPLYHPINSSLILLCVSLPCIYLSCD